MKELRMICKLRKENLEVSAVELSLTVLFF
jgi:hypothetical protein